MVISKSNVRRTKSRLKAKVEARKTQPTTAGTSSKTESNSNVTPVSSKKPTTNSLPVSSAFDVPGAVDTSKSKLSISAPEAKDKSTTKEFGGIDVQENKSATSQFFQTPAGEFVSGVISPFKRDTTGREPFTGSDINTAGKLTGEVLNIAAVGGLGALGETAATLSNLKKQATLIEKSRETVAGWRLGGSTGIQINAKNFQIIGQAAQKVATKSGFSNPITILGATALAGTILSQSLGGKVFGQFVGQEEATQVLEFSASTALQAGDEEGYALASQARNELLRNTQFWDELSTYIPYTNTLKGLNDYRSASITAATVKDKVAQDKFNQIKTGQSPSDLYKQNKEEENEQYRINTDYYNEQRKLYAEFEREAQKQARLAEREEEKKARNEDAAFWANERAKQRKEEAMERQAIADFWSNYKRQQAELNKDNGFSALSFGLI